MSTRERPHGAILLTGGAASGKSTFGAALAARLPAPRYLIDTARPDPCDPARPLWRARMAGAGFTVIGRDTDLGKLTLPARGTVLIDCLCCLTANEMFDVAGRARDPFDAVAGGVLALMARCDNLIVITNEIGSGLADYSGGTRRYVEALGRIQATLAARFDYVYELVCGIPVPHKGGRL